VTLGCLVSSYITNFGPACLLTPGKVTTIIDRYLEVYYSKK
jgi:hypothetical protein